MPLWSDLFEGHGKDEPFKPKRTDSTLEDQVSESSKSDSGRDPPLPSTPRQSRDRSPLKTPPTVRRSADRSGGLKKSPSFSTPSTSDPSHDDTISEIHNTLEKNRKKKSSTPKTPQTPKPPAIHIDPVRSGEDRDAIPQLEGFDTPDKGEKVHLDPLNSGSQGEDSFSVDWNLDNIMNKSVQEFAQSINRVEACPSNTSHLLSNADTMDLLAASETSECQELPNDCLDSDDNVRKLPNDCLDSDDNVRKLPDRPPGESKVLCDDEPTNSAKRSLNSSNPNPWILVQVNMCVIRHLCDCAFLIKNILAMIFIQNN